MTCLYERGLGNSLVVHCTRWRQAQLHSNIGAQLSAHLTAQAIVTLSSAMEPHLVFLASSSHKRNHRLCPVAAGAEASCIDTRALCALRASEDVMFWCNVYPFWSEKVNKRPQSRRSPPPSQKKPHPSPQIDPQRSQSHLPQITNQNGSGLTPHCSPGLSCLTHSTLPSSSYIPLNLWIIALQWNPAPELWFKNWFTCKRGLGGLSMLSNA